MADLALFRYTYRQSVIHALDARCKLLCMAAFTIAVLLQPYGGRYIGLAVMSSLLAGIYLLAKQPASMVKKMLPVLLVWLPMLIVAPALAKTGTPLAPKGVLARLSQEGLQYGIGYGWKFLLFLVFSQLMVATTTVSEISKAVAWYLHPLPKPVPAVVGVLLSLTLAQIPALFDAYQQINHAQTARLGNRVKNPVKRIRNLLLPLLQNLFTRADELALAMEARCFTYHRTQYHAPISAYDCAVTAFFCLLCGLVAWVGR